MWYNNIKIKEGRTKTMIRKIEEIVETTDKAKEIYGTKKRMYTEARFVQGTIENEQKLRYSERRFRTFGNTYAAKEIEVIQADGSIRIAYLFGKQGWSYDKAEVEAFKAEWKAREAAKSYRIKLLKEIADKYTTEELENILKNF